MINLDDLDAVQKLDTSKMVDLLMDFPQQYQRAFDLSKDYISKQDKLAPEVFGKAKNIVISGMGGSAIGGDLLRTLFADKCSIPIVINRNYNIPKFVNEDTLFIAASYSGNTEETLSALEEATEKNAKIFTISSGGELEKVSKNKGFPHFSVTHKGIQPRCAFGYLFMPMATLICKLGLITDIASDIQIEYRLTKDGRYRLKGFRHNQYEGAIEGQLVETGFGIVYVRDFNYWKNFFSRMREKSDSTKFEEKP